MKPPSPAQCDVAARALKRAAACERQDGDTERAEILAKAAEIMEAKALVGVVMEVHERHGAEGVKRLADAIESRRKKRRAS